MYSLRYLITPSCIGLYYKRHKYSWKNNWRRKLSRHIDKVLIPDALLLIPINEEMYLVGHITSTFFAWPMCLVVMDGDQQPKKYAPKKKKGTGKGTSQPIAPMTHHKSMSIV